MARYVMIPKKILIAWLVAYVALLVLIGGAYLFAYNNSKNICEILTTQDRVYKEAPPQTVTGQNMAQAFSRAVQKFHC